MQLVRTLIFFSLITLCAFCNLHPARVSADNDNSNVTVVASTQNQLAVGALQTINNSYSQKSSGIEVGPDRASILVLILFAILVGLRLIILKKQ